MRCPKCSSRFTQTNADGDLACLHCGNIVYTRETLPFSRPQKGRKKEGEWIDCKLCGTPVYYRPYQIKKGIGGYCQKCLRKKKLPEYAKLPRKRTPDIQVIDIERWNRTLYLTKIRCLIDQRTLTNRLEALNREKEILNLRIVLTEILSRRLQ